MRFSEPFANELCTIEVMRSITPRDELMKTVLVLVVALLLSTVAKSQDQSDWSDWTMGARYAVQLDLFHPFVDTKFRLDASDTSIGVTIN